MSQDTPITVRQVKLQFDSLSESPLDWYNNDAAITEFFHALSTTFPAGETFFVKSVINFGTRLQAEHPELWRQVQLFLKQEGAHSAVHEQWNARIAEESPGHPMLDAEHQTEKRLKRTRRFLSPLSQLAITASLEHWTSGLAFLLLATKGGEHILDRSKEPYRSLWVWHAVEELEHKKVAFDVYQAMGGGYLRRTTMMLAVSPLFMTRVILIWMRFCRSRNLPMLRSSLGLMRFLLFKPGTVTRFVPHWLTWFKPNFHPAATDKAEAPVLAHRRSELDAKRIAAAEKTPLDEELRGPLLLGPTAGDSALIPQSKL